MDGRQPTTVDNRYVYVRPYVLKTRIRESRVEIFSPHGICSYEQAKTVNFLLRSTELHVQLNQITMLRCDGQLTHTRNKVF